MMLRFQWDSLRRADHLLLVHDVDRAGLGLRPAVVVLVDSSAARREVAMRYTDGRDTGRVVRPGRFATHPDPLAGTADCWRCAEARAA